MKIYLNTKHIGFVVILFSVAFALVVLDFTRKVEGLNAVLHQNCSLPDAVCPFVGMPYQATMGFAAASMLFAFGAALILISRKDESEMTEKKEKMDETIKALDKDGQKIYEAVKNSGAIFQSELVEKSGFTKVRVTRILDRLEAGSLVERKRRGMTNIVTVKR